MPRGNHVLVAPADGGPVPTRVLEQLVGLREPERPLPAAQPLVEDDGGDLATLAASGTVAQHPAAPEAHRRGQRLVVVGTIVAVIGAGMKGVTILIALAVDAMKRLPAGADAVERGEMALVRLAGEDDALELGVGEQALGHDAGGQHGMIGGRRVRHRRHGA